MVLRLFGLKKKGKGAEAPPHEPAMPGHTPEPEPAPARARPTVEEPVEFVETAGAPAAASPPQAETVPAAVGSAQALRAVRAAARRPKPAKAAPAAKPKGRLTPKQLAQRKYAARMRTVRKRATKASGGKGRIAQRSGATKLRRQLGLKPGKAAKPATKAKAKGGKGAKKASKKR